LCLTDTARMSTTGSASHGPRTFTSGSATHAYAKTMATIASVCGIGPSRGTLVYGVMPIWYVVMNVRIASASTMSFARKRIECASVRSKPGRYASSSAGV